jgi:putative sigma-54 modulation protein
METPLHITFVQMVSTPVLEADVHEKLEALQALCDRITSCRVSIEAPSRHHRKGGHFHVRIELHVPGEMLVIGRSPDQHAAHEDAHVALREAFKALRGRLEDYVQRRRGEVKHHQAN